MEAYASFMIAKVSTEFRFLSNPIKVALRNLMSSI